MLKRLWNNLQQRWRPAWQDPAVLALYAAVTAQARQPSLYQAGGVPDTLDGRFDLLALFLALMLRRLRECGDAAEAMRQQLFDLFAADLDRSLREMGIGDMGISRRIKLMGQACYGRMAAYEAALAQPEATRRAALMTALDKNLYGTVPTAPAALGWMAEHVLAAVAALAAQPLEQLLHADTATTHSKSSTTGT
jgi:cytochrome b pre-mRNA-processing protein 3